MANSVISLQDQFWKIIEFAPDYEVSEYGVVMRLTEGRAKNGKTFPGKIVKQVSSPGTYWYWQVGLIVGGKKIIMKTASLVARTFISPKPFPEAQAAHLDGDIDNNHYSNLEWATALENASHKYIHGTIRYGEKAWNAVLNEDMVRQIRHLLRYMSQRELAAELGIKNHLIADVAAGRSWGHVR